MAYRPILYISSFPTSHRIAFEILTPAFPCPAAGLEAASQPCSAALIAISHTLPPLRTFTGTLHWGVAREGANSHLAVRDVLADPLLEVRPGRLGHSRTAQCCYV